MNDTEEVDVVCPRCGHEHTIEIEPLHPNAPDKMYKLHEVENILGLARRTLRQLIYDGKLRAIKKGEGRTSHWLVYESSITQYQRSREKR